MLKIKPESLHPRFAITMGDPAGIGPEVSIKGVTMLSEYMRRRIVLICDMEITEAARRRFGKKISLSTFDSEKLPPKGSISVIGRKTRGISSIREGKVSATGGRASAGYIQEAVSLCIAGRLDGIITAPIHKKALSLGGVNFPGHTEMLAKLANTADYAMMMASPQMRVVLVTTHLSLRNAISRITPGAILEKLKLMNKALKPQKPIAVCGLNPHASDDGLFGSDEKEIIIPAINKARRLGINVMGPFPADTIFSPQIRSNYEAILAMYHDQGLVAIKSVSFGNCTNVTLGLPFIRTSVDHGTAMDIAGKGIADASSMAYAIKTAFNMYKNKE